MPHINEAPVLQISRFYTGLYTFRNPLVVPIRQFGRKLVELYDALIAGSNMEITNTLTLKRRPGYTAYNTSAIQGVPQTFYSFKPSSQPGTVLPIVDTTAGVFNLNPGSGSPLVLLTKNSPLLPGTAQTNFCGIGPYLYMANPTLATKWGNDPQGVTFWGISIGAIAGSLGPNPPGAAANVFATGQAWASPNNILAPDGVYSTATVSASSSTNVGPNYPSGGANVGLIAWTNPQNARFDDNALASVNVGAGGTSGRLSMTGYGFSIPSTATITGFKVDVKCRQGTPGTGNITDGAVTLMKAGTPVGANRANGLNFPTTLTYQSYGGSSDLWGTTWTYNDVNNANFGVSFSVIETGGINPRFAFVDAIRMTVYYTIPAGNGTSDFLQATQYGFSLPATSVVTGIGVQVLGFMPGGQASSYLKVQLMSNGAPVGNAKTMFLPSSDQPTNLGGAGDLWGTSWTASNVNATNFGVSIQAFAIGVNSTFNIDCVEVTIFEIGGPTVTTTGSGTFTAQVGYQYVFCYGNSVSGHVSSPTPVSINTGPFTNVANAVISLTASIDPQVNQIRVFRTTDGGGQPFFELPTSPYPNTTQNVNDSATDNLLQIANIAPVPHFNDPPPAGLVDPVWYAGRLWGHVGSQLFFASGPDVTLGNGQEAWYPVYQFAMPTTIIRKFPLPNGMLIVTTDDIFVVRGIDTTSFTVNEFIRDTGMRNWNAADSDGSNIYLYTTDRQLLLLNANGLEGIGTNVSDVIANVDPSLAYVSIFRYTSRNTLLFLGDGVTNIYPYNLNQQAWCPTQVPNGGAGAIGTIETAVGVWNFLRGKTSANQTIAQRSTTTFSDEGTTYTCSATFGPVPFADMLTLAQIRDIAVATAASQSTLTLSVLANEISGNFQQLSISSSEPPELSPNPSQSFTANRYSLKTANLPEVMNFAFMQFSWPSAATADELFAWAIGGTQTTGPSALGQAGKLPDIQGR